MSFANHLVSSTLLAGAVFSITAFPLAALASKPISIELDRDTVFVGSLKDIAVPYLLTTAAISIGAGVANLAVLGWRQSSRRLSHAEEQVSALTRHLSEKEIQLERLKFSDPKLEALGLGEFLQAEPQPRLLPAQPAIASSQTSFVPADVPVSVRPSQPSVPIQAAAFPAAQAFMGFARPRLEPAAIEATEMPESNLNLNNPAQVSELLTNLKQVMVQLEKLDLTHESDKGSNPRTNLA